MSNHLPVADAELDPSRTWRYSLTRPTGRKSGGVCVFIGLNPSTADETVNDPTIRRCIRFAYDWGHHELVMLNLFAFRSTSPHVLHQIPADLAIGPENDATIMRHARGASRIVLAWGVHGDAWFRDREVVRMLRESRIVLPQTLQCLGLTKDGHPRHPLYVTATTRPEPFRGLPLAGVAPTHERTEHEGVKQTLNSGSMGAAAVQHSCSQGDEMQTVPEMGLRGVEPLTSRLSGEKYEHTPCITANDSNALPRTHANSANSDDEGDKLGASAEPPNTSPTSDGESSAFAKAPIGFNNRSTKNARTEPDFDFVIRLAGELVLNNRGQLRGFLADALEAGKRTVAIDCARCGYIDAAGLGVLVSCARRLAAAGGTLALCNLNEDIWTLLGMTALEPFFLRGALPDSATPDAIVAAVAR
jgi:anti-anti-sigma factor